MRRSHSVPMLAVLFVISAGGQQKPNFSGTWQSVGSPELFYIDRIEHQDPNLKVFTEMRGSTPFRMSLEHAYVTDGTEQTRKNTKGEQWTAAYWQGPILVLINTQKEGYHVTVTRETWMLSDGESTLTKTKRVINMDEVTESKRVFKKQ